MLEAMQERRVTVGGTTRDLPRALLRARHPKIHWSRRETYPLPEAQLDRFMFLINVDYPSEEEEFMIMKMGTGMPGGKLRSRCSPPRGVIYIQQTVKTIPVPDHVYRYAGADCPLFAAQG